MTKESYPTSPATSSVLFETCTVLMLGYPGMGKRTIGTRVAAMLDGVLVDNQLINRPLLELFRWDGVAPLPPEIWDRVIPIREAVYDVIEDLAPSSNSYVFTTVLHEGSAAAKQYDRIRSLAYRRRSLFLSVMLNCDLEVQVGRIDNPDRVALRKGADPEAYREHRLTTTLYQPPKDEVIHLDTTEATPASNAQRIYQALHDRGYVTPTQTHG
jgi:adenylylsulfate kinase-like enzyme